MNKTNKKEHRLKAQIFILKSGLFLASFLLFSIQWGYAASLISARPVVAPKLSVVEDWKGELDKSEWSLGAMAGATQVNSAGGLGVVATVSKKIIAQGFIPDLANSVSIEALVGPAFLAHTTAWTYSAHLRWDFQKDATWTLFALGGVSGNWVQKKWSLSPRFGVGALWSQSHFIKLRAEISHDFIIVGANFPFY